MLHGTAYKTHHKLTLIKSGQFGLGALFFVLWCIIIDLYNYNYATFNYKLLRWYCIRLTHHKLTLIKSGQFGADFWRALSITLLFSLHVYKFSWLELIVMLKLTIISLGVVPADIKIKKTLIYLVRSKVMRGRFCVGSSKNRSILSLMILRIGWVACPLLCIRPCHHSVGPGIEATFPPTFKNVHVTSSFPCMIIMWRTKVDQYHVTLINFGEFQRRNARVKRSQIKTPRGLMFYM